MVYLLLIPALIALIWGILRWGHNSFYTGEAQGLAVIFSIVFIITHLALVIGFTLSNGAGVAKWQAFYDTNTQNYQIAITQTASYLSEEEFIDSLISGSIEKMEQAGYVSERIKEWRDAVNEYNLTIAKMQYFNDNIFTGILVSDEIEEMKTLIIK